MFSEAISKENLVFFTNLGRGGPSRNAGKPDHWSETHGVEGGPGDPPVHSDHGRNRQGGPRRTMVGILWGPLTMVAQGGAARILNTGRIRGIGGGPAGPPPGWYSRARIYFSRKSRDRGGIWSPPQNLLGPKAIGPLDTQQNSVTSLHCGSVFPLAKRAVFTDFARGGPS